jgi:hypothetical protein
MDDAGGGRIVEHCGLRGQHNPQLFSGNGSVGLAQEA